MSNETINTEAYEKSIKDLIKLISCVVCGQVPDKAWCETLDLKLLYKAAAYHALLAITAEALERAGIQNEEFRNAKAYALRKAMLYDAELKKVTNEIEKHDVWYALLKGAVLKDYYPGFGLRQMIDIDILIDPDRAEDIRSVMEGMGYSTERFGNEAHDVYHKESIYCFEMHWNLFAEYISKPFFDYYQNVRDRLIRKNDSSHELRFSKEDFYVYLIAHEYKHYSDCGTGLRSLLDVFLYLEREKIDLDYVHKATERMGITAFEETNRSLAMKLFRGGELTEDESKMFEIIQNSGMQGTMTNKVKNKSERYGGGKLKYVLQRLWMPLSKKNPKYVEFATGYPLFYKYKVLLPFLPFYRIFVSIKNKRFKTELKAMKEIEHKK